jgi:hypothetical protein
MSPDGTKLERRRSHRFQVPLPVEASWGGPDGRAIKEPAVAKQVNAQGGLLRMSVYPEIGRRVTLTNFFSAETAEARVLPTPCTSSGAPHGIAVEFIVPSETFWGVTLQAKKAEVELAKLDKSLQCEGIEPRLLREYREAVECVRNAARVVRELRARQLDGRNDDDVMASLARVRVSRAIDLTAELMTDLEAGRVGADTQGIEKLHGTLNQACNRLKSRLNRAMARSAVGAR